MTHPNRDQLLPYNNSPSDIALSQWEYQDLTDAIYDARMSDEGLMKLKRLYEHNRVNLIAIPIVGFFPAWFFSRWLCGFVHRGLAQARFHLIGMTIFYPISLYYFANVPIPRKLYTDLIANDGPDGRYIRGTLAQKKPGLSQKISRQLYDLKFQFPEMLEYKGMDFPANFVTKKVED